MLNARYYGLVQSAFFDKVEMAVVLLGMDIQPFIFLSQVDTEMVKERSILTGFQKIIAEGFFSTHKLD